MSRNTCEVIIINDETPYESIVIDVHLASVCDVQTKPSKHQKHTPRHTPRTRCPHGGYRTSCAKCGGLMCKHNIRRSACDKCRCGQNLCTHGERKRDCVVCNQCKHGNHKYHCDECSQNTHSGVTITLTKVTDRAPIKPKVPTRKFNDCGHNIPGNHCAICSPCPHNDNQYSCRECIKNKRTCVHRVSKYSCAPCNGCTHGDRRHICNDCIASKKRKRMHARDIIVHDHIGAKKIKLGDGTR